VHPGDLAGGFSDLEMTWLLYCAGAATESDTCMRAVFIHQRVTTSSLSSSLLFADFTFGARLTMLLVDHAIAKGRSVCLSVCHTGDSLLNGSRYRNIFL